MESINFASPNISINNFDKQVMDESVFNTNQRESANLYSFPGILHFLQAEWNKMETERAHWEIEKAELMAKIAFLQGEKKGQENLKEDLVRRIKMLEYALKQKNQTINDLKYGVSKANNNAISSSVSTLDSSKNNVDDNNPCGKPKSSETNVKLINDIEKAKLASMEWRESRQRLRQFLQEVGYVDTIVDARQIRLRNILSEGFFNKLNEDQCRKKHVEDSLLDVENSVMKTFEFLAQEKDKNSKGDDSIGEGIVNLDSKKQLHHLVDDENNWTSQFSNRSTGASFKLKSGKDEKLFSGLKEKNKGYTKIEKFGRLNKKDSELQDFLSHLSDENFHSDDFSVENQTEENKGKEKKLTLQNNDMDNYCNSFGLGDLASITVTNDADGENLDASKNFCSSIPQQNSSVNKDKVDSIPLETSSSKKFWNVKYTLRGHFDSVRSISFYKNESAVISGSDDGTIKVWNFNKTQLSKKGPNMEIEAVQTMRGHDGPVLSVHVLDEDLFHHGSQLAVSGGIDGSMRFWGLPNLEIDPYELYDSLQNALNIPNAHSKSIWKVDCLPNDPIIISASPTEVKLWSVLTRDNISNITREEDLFKGVDIAAFMLKEFKLTNLISDNSSVGSRITTVSILKQDPNQLLLATSTGQIHVLDIQSESIKYSIDMSKSDTVYNNYWNDQGIHSMAVHPTLPLVFTGHEDHFLRTVDIRTNSMIHSMVVHQEPVSCIDIDKNGIFLITGSHDASLRMWDMDTKSCIQEMASHRIKNNESVHAITFHPQLPFIGSCGAEGIVKIYS